VAPVTRAARVFTIPFGAPFLPTLAEAILSGRLLPGWPDVNDPLSLSGATVFVPTRRAARALVGELAGRAPGSAVLLPKVVPATNNKYLSASVCKCVSSCFAYSRGCSSNESRFAGKALV
jgi:inactivated superfamily I helicase